SITVGLNADQRAGASLTSDRPAKPPAGQTPTPLVDSKPDRRIVGGAGTRGICGTLPTLAALAPYPTGPTAHDQPALYWYISTAVSHPIEFSLTDEDEKVIQPLFETRIAPPVQPGVHQIRLVGSGARLEPGKQYKWSVALVCNPEHRSNDIVAEGFIERAKRPDETGLWYDEVMAISDLIEAAPTDMNLRLKRASLFEQVKLSDVAAYDLKTKVGDAR
ncbi:MAG TPA: DUF928 domain-containing protein, partial [Nitrospiraceae bacterium]|nr:DUF928 domain-containing protein [Nitrospiraceae bacterium]